MDDLRNDPKIHSDILTKYLSSLMSEAGEIRTNTSRLILGSSAAQLAVGGWVLSKGAEWDHKIFFLLGLVCFYLISFFLLRNLEKYFMEAASSINKIDKELGAFTLGAYIKDETLLPLKWKDFGEKVWKEPIFFYGKSLLGAAWFVSSLIVMFA